jgi:AcrR family transcriptional regulator
MARGKEEEVTAQRPRAPLSRERILAAAVDLVDHEGLEALTMRRLASTLEVEAMSLYHHLPGKDALLDGLVEMVVEEVVQATATPADLGEWSLALRQRCLAARTVMLRHPWAPALISTRTTIPPGVYGHYESILATMVQGGLSYHLAHRAIHALGSMALGFVQELFAPASAGGASVEPSEEELAAILSELPHLTAMVASEAHDHDDDMLGWCDSQAEFEFTLDLILEGLARRAG